MKLSFWKCIMHLIILYIYEKRMEKRILQCALVSVIFGKKLQEKDVLRKKLSCWQAGMKKSIEDSRILGLVGLQSHLLFNS